MEKEENWDMEQKKNELGKMKKEQNKSVRIGMNI